MIVKLAALYEGQEMLDYLTRNLKQSFLFQGNLVNGYMVSYLVLNFLWVHVPLLIVIVTGDLLAGEANAGTFRILLTRPVSRFSLVTAKYIAAFVYTLVIVIFLAMLSIGLGLLIFGKGEHDNHSGTVITFFKLIQQFSWPHPHYNGDPHYLYHDIHLGSGSFPGHKTLPFDHIP